MGRNGEDRNVGVVFEHVYAVVLVLWKRLVHFYCTRFRVPWFYSISVCHSLLIQATLIYIRQCFLMVVLFPWSSTSHYHEQFPLNLTRSHKSKLLPVTCRTLTTAPMRCQSMRLWFTCMAICYESNWKKHCFTGSFWYPHDSSIDQVQLNPNHSAQSCDLRAFESGNNDKLAFRSNQYPTNPIKLNKYHYKGNLGTEITMLPVKSMDSYIFHCPSDRDRSLSFQPSLLSASALTSWYIITCNPLSPELTSS